MKHFLFPQTYMTGLYTEKPVLIIPLSIKHFYIHPALSLASGDWGNNPTFLRLAYLSIYQGGKIHITHSEHLGLH